MQPDTMVSGKTITQWVSQYPEIDYIMALEELFWSNPRYAAKADAAKNIPFGDRDRIDAHARLMRFAPYIARQFPETAGAGGVIESPLIEIPAMQRSMEDIFGLTVPGRLLLKCDSHLPISGSIKARGGIHAVLKHAETLAVENGLLSLDGDYSDLGSDEMRAFFSRYAISVGSTGNLGLSIGIMGATLGFSVFVHMSADAKSWKKKMLRTRGVTVVEHASDYSRAVSEGRRQARADDRIHFIDDESSVDLFMGYAAAADHVRDQLDAMGQAVDADHPLFVYLPCGVGGGPGGLTFGLKSVYGDHVHCFFAEPTHSPCMLLGLLTRRHEEICVQDFGIDNLTAADGLAVGRPSGLVGRHLERMISGVYTVDDDMLFILLGLLADTENKVAEPSAMAAMPGPVRLNQHHQGRAYLRRHGLSAKMDRAAHLIWSTGGSMVPDDENKASYQRGKALRFMKYG